MLTTKPGTMFSTSSMTRVSARTISNSPVSVPALVTTKVTGPDGTVTALGEHPISLTETATRPPDGAAPVATLTGEDRRREGQEGEDRAAGG